LAKVIRKLSAIFVGRVSDAGMYPDGGGLYLQVTSAGAKSWIYRYEQAGREHAMGLGSLSVVSLSDARAQADECRRLRQQRIDPIEHRKNARVQLVQDQAKNVSFSEASERYIASHSAGWRNAKHNAQWANTIATYAKPVIGSLPVQVIDTRLIMNVLTPIWNEIPETASRLRGRIENILDWAKVNELRVGENPARWRGHLDKLLPRKSKVRPVVHHPALPFTAIPEFIPKLLTQKGISAHALEFTILNAARTSETIGAVWKEIDVGSKTWTIPANRMKGGVEHSVPLSSRSLDILRKMRTENPDGEFVFPGTRHGKPLSNMAMAKLLKRMEYSDITVHGFRSTFSDWAGETTNFPDDVIEMSLAHQIEGKVKAAYRRGVLFQKRRRLLATWAEYCSSEKVPIQAKLLQMAARSHLAPK
jgi:integrase